MRSNAFFKSHGVVEDDLAKLENFIESPVINGYRNKCEFTVGRHPETQKATVGNDSDPFLAAGRRPR